MPNRTAPGMPQVPLDVVYGILSKCECKQDLLSASLVNRDFALASRPALFRHIVINLSRLTACFSLLDTLTAYEGIRSHVREIKVTGTCKRSQSREGASTRSGRTVGMDVESSDDGERFMKALAKATSEGFRRMPLATVRWNAFVNIPSNFVQALARTFPACSLMIGYYTGAPLPPSPNLVSLSATVNIPNGPISAFQPILLQSPNLCALELRAYRQTGCVRIHYPPPGFLKYDKAASPKLPGCPPVLEELKLENLSFSATGVSAALKMLDWSRLRVLSISDGRKSLPLLHALVPAMSRIPALEDFFFSCWWFSSSEERTACRDAIRDVLLSTASGLLMIDLEGPFTMLASDIAEHQGHSLLKLRLHHPESTKEDDKDLLEVVDLEKMGSKCVKLEELSIDVATDFGLLNSLDTRSSGMEEVFRSEAYFPCLRTLGLHAELGIRQEAQVRFDRGVRRIYPLGQPWDAFEECKAIIPRFLLPMELAGMSVHQGSEAYPKLRQLHVYVGESRRMGGGRPASWVLWEQSENFHLQLERIEGDERVAIKATGGPGSLKRRHPETTGAWTIDHACTWTIDPAGKLNL